MISEIKTGSTTHVFSIYLYAYHIIKQIINIVIYH